MFEYVGNNIWRNTFTTKLFYKSLLIAMEDAPNAEKNPRVVTFSEAKELNKKGYGIFITINGFEGRRIKENVVSINAWAVDLDSGDKKSQLARINQSPIPPTMIIETKNGFHVWFAAKDGTIENYNEIVGRRLVPFFGADPNAKDICRMLRCMEFYHMKDPSDPYLVQVCFWKKAVYTEDEMLRLFKPPPEPKNKVSKVAVKTDFDPTKEVPCKEGLISLSGTHWVNGDVFTFQPHNNGTEQIWVNGKSSSCWIDKDGKIGSHDKGGPGLFQWLHWYYRDYKIVGKIMREHFNV